jgi:hypothetical protein
MGSEYIDPYFLDQALVGGEWSASRPDRFISGERDPSTHWIEGWMEPRAGMDDVGTLKFLILPGLELRFLCRPDRGQSLYRLCLTVSLIRTNSLLKNPLNVKENDEHALDVTLHLSRLFGLP